MRAGTNHKKVAVSECMCFACGFIAHIVWQRIVRVGSSLCDRVVFLRQADGQLCMFFVLSCLWNEAWQLLCNQLAHVMQWVRIFFCSARQSIIVGARYTIQHRKSCHTRYRVEAHRVSPRVVFGCARVCFLNWRGLFFM